MEQVQEQINYLGQKVTTLEATLGEARETINYLRGQLDRPPPPRPNPQVKLRPYGNEPHEDWLVFKGHFNRIKALNNYTNRQSVLALAAAMTGKAAAAVLDIDTDDRDDPDALLEEYENRFLPASASQMSRVKFDQALQGKDESLLDYHARLRSLWNKAYPGAREDTQLIRKFNLGLRRKEVREQVVRANPQTYGRALEAAQNEASVVQVVNASEIGAATAANQVEPMDISAIRAAVNDIPLDTPPAECVGAIGDTSTGAAKRKCFICDKEGHWRNECPVLRRAIRILNPMRYTNPVGRGAATGAGNPRGRGTYRGNTPFRGRGNGRGGISTNPPTYQNYQNRQDLIAALFEMDAQEECWETAATGVEEDQDETAMNHATEDTT